MKKNVKDTAIREKLEVSISKEELSKLPAEKFEGEIMVVYDEEGMVKAAAELKESSLIGFDTETKPSFQKGHINNVALLQLATPEKSYLIRLSHLGMPDAVKQILEDENIFKVGLSIKDDFHSLAKISELKPKGFIDLQEYVKQFGISDCSLTKIHAIVFGKRISKSQQLTNWEASNLTRKQQEYAALDALACVRIYQQLNSGAFIPEESPYYKHIAESEINE